MKTHVMIAETGCRDYVKRIERLGWGRMYVFRKIYTYPGEKWGFDNGAFDAWQNKNIWDARDYLSRLCDCPSRPYLAVVPDIVAAGCQSLDFSLDWMECLPLDWPWYLAVQDGMDVTDVDAVLPKFSGLFLGGTDKFKYSAHKWCDLAHARGKKFHYGRAGTLTKLKHALRIGADSLDSSFMLWTKERFDIFTAQWLHEDTQHELELGKDIRLDAVRDVFGGRYRLPDREGLSPLPVLDVRSVTNSDGDLVNT